MSILTGFTFRLWKQNWIMMPRELSKLHGSSGFGEASGKLLYFHVEEGTRLKAGEEVGLIDTLQLYLKKSNCRPA